jgi:predicted oxidoreductase
MGVSQSRLIQGIWRIGDWGLDSAGVANLIEARLDLGINTFDLADIYNDYQCEALFGAALAQRPQLKSRVHLISKCGIALMSAARPTHRIKHYNTSREHMLQSVDHSLAALGVERLDTLLIHRPDPLMDADEITEAVTALQRAGKIKHFGVSNFLPHQFDLLQSRLDKPMVVNQVEVSLLHTDGLFDGTLDQCQRLRVVPQAWSPLAGGAIAALDPASLSGQVLDKVAAAFDATREQIAIAWLLKHPSGIRPVVGSGKIERIQALVEAEKIELDRQQWFELLEAARGCEVP